MRNALVVVDAREGVERLTREAGKLAEGVGASLVLLHVTSNTEYEEDRRAMREIDAIEGGSYDVSQAGEGAREFAQDLGRELLADLDVEFEPVGKVGDKYDRIVETAREHDCDHVFIAGRRRSPSGKAIFGDVAQQVILNFDGPVTILTARE